MSTPVPAVVSNFNFNTSSIRVVNIEDAPWFVADDVCALLGFTLQSSGGHKISSSQHLKNLGEDEKQMIQRSKLSEKNNLRMLFDGASVGGNPRTILISESGLYKLVMRSSMPNSLPFRDWVTKVVLPAIRKDGGYVMGEEKVVTGEMSEDELVLKVMQMQATKVERLKAERDAALLQVDTLSGEIRVSKPKADYFDEVVGVRKESISEIMRMFERVNMNSGKATLFAHGYLYKTGKHYRVRSEYKGEDKLFIEKLHAPTGTHEIFVTAKGKLLMQEFHKALKFPLKKQYQ